MFISLIVLCFTSSKSRQFSKKLTLYPSITRHLHFTNPRLNLIKHSLTFFFGHHNTFKNSKLNFVRFSLLPDIFLNFFDQRKLLFRYFCNVIVFIISKCQKYTIKVSLEMKYTLIKLLCMLLRKSVGSA